MKRNLQKIETEKIDTLACGYEAIKVALRVAEILGITDFKEIKYENSGDVTLDKDRVVGYASIGAWKSDLKTFSLDENAKKEALEIARTTLSEFLTNQNTPVFHPTSQYLYKNIGTFVTLSNNEELRGCIGQHTPSEPLYKVIRDMTIAAATLDKRFSPVTKAELGDIDIEVSILSPQKQINDWREIELGKHGVVIRKGLNSGTFLPQVATDNNFTLEEFLEELCSQKVGLPPDCYKDPKTDILTFEAFVFEE